MHEGFTTDSDITFIDASWVAELTRFGGYISQVIEVVSRRHSLSSDTFDTSIVRLLRKLCEASYSHEHERFQSMQNLLSKGGATSLGIQLISRWDSKELSTEGLELLIILLRQGTASPE